MANAEKVAAVAELTERFRGSSGAVLTEYRGLTVAQLAELRRSLGGHATFAVVKNTLTKIAVNEAGLDEQLSSLLAGPSAIAFVDGDVVEAAKGLRDFAKANPLLVIKGGVLDGKAMSPSEITSRWPARPRRSTRCRCSWPSSPRRCASSAPKPKAALPRPAPLRPALPRPALPRPALPKPTRLRPARPRRALPPRKPRRATATKADQITRGPHARNLKERGRHHHGEDEH